MNEQITRFFFKGWHRSTTQFRDQDEYRWNRFLKAMDRFKATAAKGGSL